MLPLFRECSKSPAMIRHTMDVVKQAVEYLNPGQIPVVTFDQPLFTIAKQIQWNWSDVYGEEKFVIMMGSLHIEMTALKTLGMTVKLDFHSIFSQSYKECYNLENLNFLLPTSFQ